MSPEEQFGPATGPDFLIVLAALGIVLLYILITSIGRNG